MKRIALAFLLAASPAFAQQQTVDTRHLAATIGMFVIQNAALADQVEKLQAQLDVAKKRIQVLEDASKTPPPPKP